MAVKGGRNVRLGVARIMQDVRGRATRQAMQAILIAGEGNAISMAPIDTGNLANSRYRDIQRSATGYRGRVGFTADYAAFVHSAPGKLKGQQRANGNGDYWDPDGEPEFLRKAFEDPDGQEQIRRILRGRYGR